MKKLFSVLLALVMVFSLTAPALAAEGAVTPAPPEWYEELYVTFPGDEVYQPENWAEIERLRQEARNGKEAAFREPLAQDVREHSPGTVYEYALICLKYAENAQDAGSAMYAMEAAETCIRYVKRDERIEVLPEASRQKVKFLGYQCTAYSYYAVGDVDTWCEGLIATLDALGKTVYGLYASPYMKWSPEENRRELFTTVNEYLAKNSLSVSKYMENTVQIYLDGQYIVSDIPPEVYNGRTMIPIRVVAETMGADVDWDPDTRQVTLRRGGTTIVMTVDSTAALVDGEAVDMDTAPYISGGRTLIPVRYMAEFFGQKVGWDGERRWVTISEDKSVADGSNLEAWTVALGLIRWRPPEYAQHPNYPNGFGASRTMERRDSCRANLVKEWGVASRERLISLIQSMTYNGHNSEYESYAALLTSLSEETYDAYYAQADKITQYHMELTKLLVDEWGDKGILAWDMSRMATLCEWGYAAGYLSFEEALSLMEPVARQTCETFSSWQEFYENYLAGRMWWSGETTSNMAGEFIFDIWRSERGPSCRSMLNKAELQPILNDALFTDGVLALPAAEAA